MPSYGPTSRSFVNGTGNIQVPIKPGYSFALLYIRCHFRRLSGSGTDVANMTIDLDSFRGDDFDVRMLTLTSVGVAADVNLRVVEEIDHWTFDNDDCLTVNWTNPEIGGEIAWGLEVGIRPCLP